MLTLHFYERNRQKDCHFKNISAGRRILNLVVRPADIKLPRAEKGKTNVFDSQHSSASHSSRNKRLQISLESERHSRVFAEGCARVKSEAPRLQGAKFARGRSVGVRT